MADELKAQGNAAFAAKDFKKAIEFFTKAIEVDGSNHVLYSNRSASYASLNQFDQALADAEKTIALKKDWGKGYGRKGAALFGQKDFAAALEAYEEGLKYDANNAMLQNGKTDSERALAQSMKSPDNGMMQIAQMFSAPGAIEKLAADPKTAAFLADPSFRATLEAIRANPAAIANNFDQRLLMCMGVLMGNNIDISEGMDTASDEPAAPEPKAPEPKAAEPEPKAEEEPAEDVDPEVAAKQKQAAAEKEKGTQAYKKKDFETAIKHYKAASELVPTNMVFLLNLGAVYLEQKDFENCIEICTKAAEVGQDNRADYKLIAKAYARVGKAYSVQSKWKDAVRWYDKAIANDRASDYLTQRKKAEKALKEEERKAYLDPAKAQEAKAQGNELFKAGDFPGALKFYSDAIKRDPSDAKLYSNRAAAYSKLAEFNLALDDCNTCITLDPEFVKGHLRKGNIHLVLKQFSDAEKAYNRALELDPNVSEAHEGLRNVAMGKRGVGLSREERAQQAMQDPEIQQIMADPVMQQILQQMSQDPNALREHLKNPEIANKIAKLAEAGIIGTN